MGLFDKVKNLFTEEIEEEPVKREVRHVETPVVKPSIEKFEPPKKEVIKEPIREPIKEPIREEVKEPVNFSQAEINKYAIHLLITDQRKFISFTSKNYQMGVIPVGFKPTTYSLAYHTMLP